MTLESFTIYGEFGVDTLLSIPLLLFNFFTLVLLQFLPRCKSCCCKCCQTHCYPVHQLTALDPNDPFELIEWPLPEPVTNIELQEIKSSNSIQSGDENDASNILSETNIEIQEIETSNSIPNEIENDKTRILSETENDIALPVIP